MIDSQKEKINAKFILFNWEIIIMQNSIIYQYCNNSRKIYEKSLKLKETFFSEKHSLYL